MEKLSKLEQETIINFNREEDRADFFTHEPIHIRKLEKLAKQFPNLVHLVDVNHHGGRSYNIPKSMIAIRQPVSETKKQLLREKARERVKK
jgi:hypothetical protein